jgi:hypothetical protein
LLSLGENAREYFFAHVTGEMVGRKKLGGKCTVSVLLETVFILGVALGTLAEVIAKLVRYRAIVPAEWAAQSAFSVGFAMALNVMYPWWRIGLGVRTATIGLLLMSALLSLYGCLRGSAPVQQLAPVRLKDGALGLVGVILVGLTLGIIWYPMPEGVAAEYPVASGTWYVAHGGPFTMVNHHNRAVDQRYGLDIILVSGRVDGTRQEAAFGLASYLSWGAEVVAPVSGVVVAAVDGHPDLALGVKDRMNPNGNRVIIEMADGTRLVLSHLQQGTVSVHQGQRVQLGVAVGRVGNSGNTSEPHLHIHAMRKSSGGYWAGIPMYFSGRSPRRGHILRVGE